MPEVRSACGSDSDRLGRADMQLFRRDGLGSLSIKNIRLLNGPLSNGGLGHLVHDSAIHDLPHRGKSSF
jgi:hypothetical protein